MSVQGPSERLLRLTARRPLTARRAGQIIALFTIAVTLASGVLMWLLDNEEFPNLGLALWWAVQTVTTVGYGDITPHEPVGRVIATFVMLSGIGFLTVITASITAVFIESARRRLDRGAEIGPELAHLDQRLARIEALLEQRPGAGHAGGELAPGAPYVARTAQVAGTSAPPSSAMRGPKRTSVGWGAIFPATSDSPIRNDVASSSSGRGANDSRSAT